MRKHNQFISKKIREASHSGDTDTALSELERLIEQKEEWSRMATKQKEVTTLDVQIAEFIRNHKQTGVATDDEINDQLVIPFTLDVMGLRICCSASRMRVSQLRIRKEIPARAS